MGAPVAINGQQESKTRLQCLAIVISRVPRPSPFNMESAFKEPDRQIRPRLCREADRQLNVRQQQLMHEILWHTGFFP